VITYDRRGFSLSHFFLVAKPDAVSNVLEQAVAATAR
jgi:hypothetical protein